MIEITSKPKSDGKSLIDKRDLFINNIPFEELSIVKKRNIWKELSKHIEVRLINNKSLSKDVDAPYYFEDLLQSICINMGKYEPIIINEKDTKKARYSLRLYSFWDDIKFFFKDLFRKEKDGERNKNT